MTTRPSPCPPFPPPPRRRSRSRHRLGGLSSRTRTSRRTIRSMHAKSAPLSRPSPISKRLTHCGEQPPFESASTFESLLPPDCSVGTVGTGYIRLRRRHFWSAGASEARPRFGSLGAEFRHCQSAVVAALCRRTPKVPRVAYPPDSSVSLFALLIPSHPLVSRGRSSAF